MNGEAVKLKVYKVYKINKSVSGTQHLIPNGQWQMANPCLEKLIKENPKLHPKFK
jgi:hypothetical protein